MEEEQAKVVEQAFDLDYNIAQALCSHIAPKSVLLFTGEAPDVGMEFEPEDGEGDDDDRGGRQWGRRRDGLALSGLVKDNGWMMITP